MPITSPSERNWWDLPIGVHEKIWLTLVVLVGLGLFIMMPVWHALGSQNSPTETYRVAKEAYLAKVQQWVSSAERTDQGVRAPAQDVYLAGIRFAWVPDSVVLQTDVEYRIHLSSADVNHGFSLHQEGKPSQKMNFQVVPGYEYVLTMEFTDPGIYNIVCQEYCGLGHQGMVGRIVVEGR